MPKTKVKKAGSARTAASKMPLTRDQLNEAIGKKAQELYERSGRLPGRDLVNWLEAERAVKE